jgi:hypothetical protein
MRIAFTALLACLAALILGSCDYPEQGFYALVGMDGEGERVAYLPFMVDELTDDSHMTIGFTVYLPRFGELVEIPLQNGADLSRRYWQFAIADDDSQAGNLDLELEHSEERLNLSGLYQAAPRAAVQQLAGFMLPIAGGNSQLVFTSEKPEVPQALADVLYFEIHPVERGEFEEFLGTTVEKARRVAAAELPDLAKAPHAAAQPEEEEQPAPPKPPRRKDDPPKPPPLGGRR